MKKAFFYDFLPSRAEEQECVTNCIPYRPSRSLVEMRDFYPPPAVDYSSPWRIRKRLTPFEVNAGKIRISFASMFQYVFRYWRFYMAYKVVTGYKVRVIIWDVSKFLEQKTYINDRVCVEMLPDDDYTLACMDLFRDLNLEVGDEIGLFWDPRASLFQFKLLSS